MHNPLHFVLRDTAATPSCRIHARTARTVETSVPRAGYRPRAPPGGGVSDAIMRYGRGNVKDLARHLIL